MVVAITGASRGIGAATARLLARRGAAVVLGARSTADLAGVAAGIEREGGRVTTWPTDVRKRADLYGLVERATSKFGRLDVLVSNAGVGPISPMDNLRVDDWDAMIDVNLRGILYGIAAALPVFRAQRAGHFVNLASTAAYKTVPGQAVYAATKTAVRVLTDGLRQEVGPDIRVTLISPGFTNTDFVEAVPDEQQRKEMTASRERFAMPADAVARAIIFSIEQPGAVNVGELVLRSSSQP